jgi:hypothetical protein
MRTKVLIEWELSHSTSDEGLLLQVWQYVNGAGDGGFSCLFKDYSTAVDNLVGCGELSLRLSNLCYDYINKVKAEEVKSEALIEEEEIDYIITVDVKFLRKFVEGSVSDEELYEIINYVIENKYFDDDEFEFGSHYTITKDKVIADECYEELCCGTIYDTISLSNGDVIYFLFDYGH